MDLKFMKRSHVGRRGTPPVDDVSMVMAAPRGDGVWMGVQRHAWRQETLIRHVCESAIEFRSGYSECWFSSLFRLTGQ